MYMMNLPRILLNSLNYGHIEGPYPFIFVKIVELILSFGPVQSPMKSTMLAPLCGFLLWPCGCGPLLQMFIDGQVSTKLIELIKKKKSLFPSAHMNQDHRSLSSFLLQAEQALVVWDHHPTITPRPRALAAAEPQKPGIKAPFGTTPLDHRHQLWQEQSHRIQSLILFSVILLDVCFLCHLCGFKKWEWPTKNPMCTEMFYG